MKQIGLLAASLLLSSPIYAANFHFGKVKFEPVDTLAYQVEIPNAKPVTLVALTNFKIDRAAVMEAIDPAGSLVEQAAAKNVNVVIVRLIEPGKCGLAGYLGQTAQQIDLGESFPAKTISSTSARIAGD